MMLRRRGPTHQRCPAHLQYPWRVMHRRLALCVAKCGARSVPLLLGEAQQSASGGGR